MGKRDKNNTVSFVVGSKHGLRSAKWNVTVRGHDVYINIDGARDWHVSLHESGQNHLRRDVGGTPTYLTSDDELMPADAYRVGVYIMIPDYCLYPADDPDQTTDPSGWLECPQYDGCIEVAVMVWDPREAREEWPGQAAGTQMLWGQLWEDGRVVLILARGLPADHRISRAWIDHRRDMLRRVTHLPYPTCRGLTWGRNHHGVLVLAEWLLKRSDLILPAAIRTAVRK